MLHVGDRLRYIRRSDGKVSRLFYGLVKEIGRNMVKIEMYRGTPYGKDQFIDSVTFPGEASVLSYGFFSEGRTFINTINK